MAQTTQDQPCRLLSLPRELRDIIYGYAFSDFEFHVRRRWQNPFPASHPGHSPAAQNAGLVLANKQIYAETYDLYFESTTFYSFLPEDLPFWHYKLTSRARKAVRSMKVIHSLGGWFTTQAEAESIERAKADVRDSFRKVLDRRLGTDLGRRVEVEILNKRELAVHRHGQELIEMFTPKRIAARD